MVKLGIDLDGVVVDIVGQLLPYLSQICGRQISREEIQCYEFETALQMSHQQVAQMMDIVREQDLFNQAAPVDGSIACLRRFEVMDNLDWRFITSRPQWARAVTETWLSRHGFAHRELHLTDRGKPLAIKLGLDVFIDDDILTARELTSQGIRVLLMDNPWNRREQLPNNCCRVANWDEVQHELARLFALDVSRAFPR
jgi:uncharacterized HAD superfamily protein